jgi:hypothetical protein
MIPPHKSCKAIHVDDIDLWHFLLESVRYSMGRMSTAPGMTCDAVRRYAHHLAPRQREQIREEIERELAIYERSGKTLGMEYDHRTWQSMVKWLKENP